MNPTSWWEAGIETFREATHNWSQEECEALGAWDLSPPSQVLDVWFRPHDVHLAVVTQFKDEEDGKVRAVEIPSYAELFPAIERELDEERWERPAPDTWNGEDLWGPWERFDEYRDSLKARFVSFCNSIKHSVFVSEDRLRTAEVGQSSAVHGVTYIWLHGPLKHLDPRAAVRAEVGSTPPELWEPVESVTGELEPRRVLPLRPASRSPDGFWAHLYPPLAIGPGPDRSIRQEVFDHRRSLIQRDDEEFTEVCEDVIVTHDSFVAVKTPDIEDAFARLNLLALSLDLMGYGTRFLQPGDFVSFEEAHEESDTRFKSLGHPSTPKARAAKYLQESQGMDLSDPFGRSVEDLPLGDLEQAVQVAEVLHQTGHRRDLVLLHQVGTLHQERVYDAASVLGWTIIERELLRRKDQFISGQDLHPSVHSCFEDHMDRSSEVIKLLSEIDAEIRSKENEINGLAEHRNAVAHGETKASFDLSADMLSTAYELFFPRVREKVQSLPFKAEMRGSPEWLVSSKEADALLEKYFNKSD